MNLSPEEFRNAMWQKEDPKPAKEAADKLDMRKFWFLCVPLGAVIAFVLALVADNGGVFVFSWPVISLVLWGASKGLGEKR